MAHDNIGSHPQTGPVLCESDFRRDQRQLSDHGRVLVVLFMATVNCRDKGREPLALSKCVEVEDFVSECGRRVEKLVVGRLVRGPLTREGKYNRWRTRW